MTIPRRSWRGAGAFAAAAVVGLAGGVISAAPAAAHTPTWAVTCSEVTLNLTAYSSKATNEVTVSVVGGEIRYGAEVVAVDRRPWGVAVRTADGQVVRA
ncbi:hypothetical protein ABT169_26660, partial [Streptomyces sp. NPDC001616]